ncbi:MAG TPA: antibiotic biosynthesis monooxygenase [Acidimicrobiales bacterium]|nr:antibiotic biosynthesis monooxygenase [Acidimicrobiales bacterium]
MIVEHAMLHVNPGREDEFEMSFGLARPVIESAPGCHGAELRRQIEDPSTYLLLVQWSSVEAHTAFRDSDRYTTWRDLTHIFYSEPPVVTHFQSPV